MLGLPETLNRFLRYIGEQEIRAIYKHPNPTAEQTFKTGLHDTGVYGFVTIVFPSGKGLGIRDLGN